MAISSNTITLYDGATTITLPYDFIWVDEYSWTGVVSNRKLTLQGIAVVETSKILGEALRPITLPGSNAWISKSDLDTIFSWARVAGKQMTLKLHDGRQFTVNFRHEDAPVIEGNFVKDIAEQEVTDDFIITLKLIAIQRGATLTTTTTSTTTTSTTSSSSSTSSTASTTSSTSSTVSTTSTTTTTAP